LIDDPGARREPSRRSRRATFELRIGERRHRIHQPLAVDPQLRLLRLRRRARLALLIDARASKRPATWNQMKPVATMLSPTILRVFIG
jgi:hypothetical protein